MLRLFYDETENTGLVLSSLIYEDFCGNRNSHRRFPSEESQETLTFPEVSDSLREPTTSDQINAENMKR